MPQVAARARGPVAGTVGKIPSIPPLLHDRARAETSARERHSLPRRAPPPLQARRRVLETDRGCGTLACSVSLRYIWVVALSEPSRMTAIKQLTPVMVVDQVEPCLAFWVERFGFTVENQVPGPDGKILFASASKDGIEVMYQTRASVVAETPDAASELNWTFRRALPYRGRHRRYRSGAGRRSGREAAPPDLLRQYRDLREGTWWQYCRVCRLRQLTRDEHNTASESRSWGWLEPPPHSGFFDAILLRRHAG